MRIVGVTGGSGCGKTVFCDCLRARDIPVLDTDRVARLIVEPGQPALAELAEYFGGEIIDEEGRLRRQTLADLVFDEPDEAKRAQKQAALNRITHHYVIAYTDDWLAEQRAREARVAVLDVPLLFESGMEKQCDLTVSVIASPETRIARIMTRDGITRVQAEHRLRAQPSAEFYVQRSDEVVVNDADTTLAQLDEAAQKLLEKTE